MNSDGVVSHFWVGGYPFFSSTILIASPSAGVIGGRIPTAFELFDVDGSPVNSFNVEFPEGEVGVVELEPFSMGLKMRGGIQQGHLVVRSPGSARHFCRQQMGAHFDIVSSPRCIKNRESAFVPMILGAMREHLVVFVNASQEVGQVVVRLLYGSRSPEWTVTIPAYGCSAIALEDELLKTFDDTSWQKGALQGYLRISARLQSVVACQVIEKLPGETQDQEHFRCLTSW